MTRASADRMQIGMHGDIYDDWNMLGRLTLNIIAVKAAAVVIAILKLGNIIVSKEASTQTHAEDVNLILIGASNH